MADENNVPVVEEFTPNPNSILDCVKLFIGIDPSIDVFDTRIIFSINSAFFVLWELGAGDNPSSAFKIAGRSEEWTNFISNGDFEAVKSYICLSVQLDFDPPSSSYLVDRIKEKLNEYECRVTYAVDEKNSQNE